MGQLVSGERKIGQGVSVVVRRMYYWDSLTSLTDDCQVVSVVVRRMYYWDSGVSQILCLP